MKKFLFVFLICSPIIAKAQSTEQKFNLYKSKFDALFKLKPSFVTDTLMISYLDSIVESPMKMRQGKKQYFKEYEEIANRVNWPKGKARYKMWYGNYLADKNPILGVKYLIDAEAELELIKDYQSQIFTLMRLSMALTHHTDSLSALKYLDKALNIAKDIKSNYWQLQVLNNKANFYVYRNRLDIAIPIFEQIDKFKNMDLRNRIINDLNLGMCYINFKKIKEGMPYLVRSLKSMDADTLTFSGLQKQVRMDLIDNLIDVQRDFIGAKKYFLELEILFKKQSNIKVQTNNVNEFNERYHKIGHKIYKGLNDTEMALFHLENRNKYTELINEVNKKNSEEGIRTQLNLSEQTKKLQKTELQKLKLENEKQNTQRWIWIGIGVLGFLTSFYVLKTNKALKQKNEELAQKFDEISAAHLKGQTTERQRVAIDLHDNLGSTISSIKYSLEAIDRSKMDADEVAVQENLYSLLDKAYNDVRLLSHNLLPEEFEKKGLTETLTEFIRKINKASKIKFDLNIDENFGRHNHKIEFELYSICMELVNNIMKHSKATSARITLEQIPPLGVRGPEREQIRLTVSDNGIGLFKNESDGKGMKNIHARVDSIGGVWKVKSIEGKGVVNEIVV